MTLDLFRLNRPSDENIVPVFPAGTTIPKIIHQTYHAPPWPDAIAANVERLKNRNPGWDYRFYDHETRRALVKDLYGDSIVSRYDKINSAYGAAQADLFRYLLLYKFGGVYLDMKSSTDVPLDTVLREDDVFLLSSWRNAAGDNVFENWGMHAEVSHLPFGEYQQWHVACAPGHPFLRRVIAYVLRNIDTYMPALHSAGVYAVLRVTGPVPYTLAIESLRGTQPHRMVDSKQELGLVYSIFDKDGGRSHEKFFPNYKTRTDPLIRMEGERRVLNAVLGPLKRLFKARGRLMRA